jgi:hypothetical protein
MWSPLSSSLLSPTGNVPVADRKEILEAEIRMQQTELSGQFQDFLRQSERRVQYINYILAVLLVIVLVWAVYAAWRSSLQEKIESITLVEGSVAVDGATSLCPGDTLTVRYSLDVEGVGVIIADDSVEYANRTVKFSESRRDIISQSGRRGYEVAWTIPDRPEVSIGEFDEWVPGLYVRHITVAASNIYVSRYTDPVRFWIPFAIKGDC